MNAVLLVIDVQNGCLSDKLYKKDEVISNLKRLISFCRSKSVEVIYVRHDDGKNSMLEKGFYNWQICAEIEPKKNEKVFDKTVNSAFRDSGLAEYLRDKNVDTVIITGLQTEYCIDANIKAAFEHGFRVLVPEGTFSTIDNGKFTAEMLNEFFANTIWNKRYAYVIPIDKITERL